MHHHPQPLEVMRTEHVMFAVTAGLIAVSTAVLVYRSFYLEELQGESKLQLVSFSKRHIAVD